MKMTQQGQHGFGTAAYTQLISTIDCLFGPRRTSSGATVAFCDLAPSFIGLRAH